jgi:transcriptional regulator with XRE-family HTH domain
MRQNMSMSNSLNADKTTREFGTRIRALRKELAMSQEELGEVAGLHRTYIGHLERGEVNPSLINILRVAKALKVDPSNLVSGLKVPRR